MNHHPLLIAAVAAALALAAAPASAAGATDAARGQPIRVEPTFHALRMPAATAPSATAAQQSPVKPQVLSRPGPVGVMRGRLDAAGELETWCTLEHAHGSGHLPSGHDRRERQR